VVEVEFGEAGERAEVLRPQVANFRGLEVELAKSGQTGKSFELRVRNLARGERDDCYQQRALQPAEGSIRLHNEVSSDLKLQHTNRVADTPNGLRKRDRRNHDNRVRELAPVAGLRPDHDLICCLSSSHNPGSRSHRPDKAQASLETPLSFFIP